MSKLTTIKPLDWSNPDNLKAYSWCLDHDITIGMLAASQGYANRYWTIEITIDKKKIKSPKEYGPDELYSKVFELYKFYYNKYKDE
jgi:hypothetical protein